MSDHCDTTVPSRQIYAKLTIKLTIKTPEKGVKYVRTFCLRMEG